MATSTSIVFVLFLSTTICHLIEASRDNGFLPKQSDEESANDFDFENRKKDPLYFEKLALPQSQQEQEDARHTKLLHFHLWEEFKELFNKTYRGASEELMRFKTFVSNLHKIRDHNDRAEKGMETFTMRMNQFGDWKHKEFLARMNGYKRLLGDETHRPHKHMFLSPLNVQIPESIDWREKGFVTPVKDQSHCGSCWAFSATGALEGQHKRKSGKLISMSEQNLVDCSRKYGNEGCNGGLMDNAFTYIKENHGIDTEVSYPYEAKDKKCRFNPNTVAAVDYGFIDIPEGDEQKLKEAIATVGPISVAIDASQESFMFYHRGIYQEKHCSSSSLDHGVLAVGYGTNNGTDYYIVKNSWGEQWGDKGYILMARNRRNMCGIATAASYPIV